MPPPDKVIDNAVDSLSTIQLKSFTAEPSSVLPLNEVTLRWETTKPSGSGASNVVFKLLGLKVSSSGSRTIRPVRPISVSLSAEAAGVRTILGSVSINVDLSGCFVNSISERELLTRFREDLNEEFPEDEGKKIELENLPDLRVRVKNDRTQLRVDTGGMKVAGEFDVEIDDVPDGTLKFDALIGLGAENGQPVHKILKFNSDFDFSGTVDILSLGLGKLVDKIIDSVADDDVRDAVDNSIREMLSELRGLLPSTCALLTVSPAVRRVDFTLCPTQDGVVCRPSLLRLVTREISAGRSEVVRGNQ
jgi:hypothetical protein